MEKSAVQIHNELVDRVENEKGYLKEFDKHNQTPSDYQIGYYDALCHFLKWIEERE